MEWKQLISDTGIWFGSIFSKALKKSSEEFSQSFVGIVLLWIVGILDYCSFLNAKLQVLHLHILQTDWNIHIMRVYNNLYGPLNL